MLDTVFLKWSLSLQRTGFFLIAEFKISFKRENSFAFSKMNHNNSFGSKFFNLNGKNSSSFVIDFPKKKFLRSILIFNLKITFYL